MSKRCSLNLFTWSYFKEEGTNEEVLSPVCPLHPNSRVFLKRSGGYIAVLCQDGAEHPVGKCSTSDFESERSEATGILGCGPLA